MEAIASAGGGRDEFMSPITPSKLACVVQRAVGSAE